MTTVAQEHPANVVDVQGLVSGSLQSKFSMLIIMSHRISSQKRWFRSKSLVLEK